MFHCTSLAVKVQSTMRLKDWVKMMPGSLSSVKVNVIWCVPMVMVPPVSSRRTMENSADVEANPVMGLFEQGKLVIVSSTNEHVAAKAHPFIGARLKE